MQNLQGKDRVLNLERKRLRMLAAESMLFALCLVFSWFESLLPLPFPLPVKYGLANIPVMFALFSGGFRPALLLAFLKALFALSTRGALAAFLSFSGGLLSLLLMQALRKVGNKRFSYIFLSVNGALAHNIAQFLVVLSLYRAQRLAMFYSLLPPLLLFGLLAGILTGLVLKALFPLLQRLSF